MVKLVPSSVALLFVLVFHLGAHPTTAVLKLWVHDCDNVNGNYTSSSTYKSNLDSVLTKMATTDINYGFYNFSAGQTPDVANLISLCRGDVSVGDCHTCQAYVKSQIDTLCSNQKTAIFWSDDCMIRYSNDSIFGVMEETPYWPMVRYVTIDLSDTARYNQVVGQLLESLPSRASAGNSTLKFATNQSEFNSSLTIYSAEQCTPDLTQKDCLLCLNSAVSELKAQCSGQRGARFLFPSCNVRYEETKFYLLSDGFPTLMSPSLPSSTNGKGSSRKTTKIIVAAIAGSICVLLIVVACFIVIRKTKLHWNLITNKLNVGDDISSIESLQFNFNIIRAATGNFADANKLGEGGFGAVYKGTLFDNRQEIAVKRPAGNSSQGEDEFKTEVTLLAKLQHRNLVRLLGFCLHNKERLLIYEFVANASLDRFLFGANRRAHLGWETRYKIIRGIARGILYLHEDSRLRIIHRDLKASNVLLDAEMCPKIADFGTARLFDNDQTHSDTRRIVGT